MKNKPFRWALILFLVTKCIFFEHLWRRTIFFAFWRSHGIDCAYEPKRAQNDHISTQSWADLEGSKRWNAFFSFFKLNDGKKPGECIVLQLRGTKCGSYKQFWKLRIFEIFWQNSNLLKIRPKFRRFPGINYFSILRLI